MIGHKKHYCRIVSWILMNHEEQKNVDEYKYIEKNLNNYSWIAWLVEHLPD